MIIYRIEKKCVIHEIWITHIFYVNRGVDMGEVPYVVVVRKYVENNSFFKKK